ncbi:Kef-type K+ transport system membrane component KefB [Natronocella acetinitrilica]|uniref:Kef-type K+ transport system membrane component KefB n=1 Tax=Natronocella acetinitrilica TaxID=414046 RepID=A0AAE3G4P7_9GAMM|nr:cation:proton antiporter [Natronocella acetinitrilica]MCP1675765.1 Kef-type K+ transport system membrane component KefB [Natronocella acetinitrilica]
MELLLTIGLLMAVGGIGGAIAVRLRLPRITGYIFAGILLSPSVLPLLTWSLVDDLNWIALAALGVIGYAIGTSIRLDMLRGLGRSIAWITLSQGFAAWLLTMMLLAPLGPYLYPGVENATLFGFYLPIAFLLGAIAWPTAPAVTIALIREVGAKGVMTTATLTIVALSDAAAVIAFGLSLELTRAFIETGAFSWTQGVAIPAAKLAGSIVLGITAGAGINGLARLLPEKSITLMTVVLGGILLAMWAASELGLSTILATLVMGFTAVNLPRGDRLGTILHPVEGLVFVVFFVISGVYFDLAALETAWLLAIMITVARCVGKYAGASIGAIVSDSPRNMRRYLGLILLPKAGLTLGLAFLARDALGDPIGNLLFNGLLASTILNMIFTPPLAKWALLRSGEARLN